MMALCVLLHSNACSKLRGAKFLIDMQRQWLHMSSLLLFHCVLSFFQLLADWPPETMRELKQFVQFSPSLPAQLCTQSTVLPDNSSS